ncbi:hypothetical protein B0H13DRAFT_2328364 [Mycena leptocephala]|nr:hypothetical protein B0H13DRAFT_2328364 [Mycena leptocephala]
MAMTKPGLGGRPLTGGKAPRKTVSGKTVAGKFTTAKRSTGAPAPRLALGSNVTVPSTSALLSAAVPFRTSGNLPKQIRLAGADWEILGRGVFDECLNDRYCLVCRDGGKIFLCSVKQTCEAGLCFSCLDSPSPEVQALPFCCPKCHLNREMYRRSRTKETDEFIPQPYEGFMGRRDGKAIIFKSGAGIRSFASPCTPIPMLAQFLECMFPDDFGYIPVPFNIGSDAGMRNLQEATSALAESLKTGELRTVRRILIVVLSHTNPAGDIHIAPKDAGAAIADQLRSSIEEIAFTTCGRHSSDHLLVFLTCGALFTVPEAVKGLNRWFLKFKSFWGLLGFEAAKLQPEITIAFLTAVIKKFFFHNQKNFLEDYLAVSSHLGSHSAVVYLRGNDKAPYRYVWAHPVHAPFGMPTPLSCICGMVGSAIAPPTRKRKRQELRAEKLEVHCQMCPHVRKFWMPDDFEFRV